MLTLKRLREEDGGLRPAGDTLEDAVSRNKDRKTDAKGGREGGRHRGRKGGRRERETEKDASL